MKPKSPLKAIRAKCLDCSLTSNEVKLCTVKDCALYPFRSGKNPYRKKRVLNEEQKRRLAEQLARGREKQKQDEDDFLN